MTANLYIPLHNRSVIAISGKNRKDFLQRMLSNDVNNVTKDHAIYALLLTPQGKFLYDFFICERHSDSLWLDIPAIAKEEIITSLNRYKLRADVTIEDLSDTHEVVALTGPLIKEKIETQNPGATRAFCKGITYLDPRKLEMDARAIIEKENQYHSFIVHEFTLGNGEDYESQRIAQGVPCGVNDLISGKDFPHDFALDSYHAIDYNKGCYVGQEVTARVHHLGKKHKYHAIVKSKDNSPLPDFGATITLEGKNIGTLRSHQRHIGIAVVKKEITGHCLVETEGQQAELHFALKH